MARTSQVKDIPAGAKNMKSQSITFSQASLHKMPSKRLSKTFREDVLGAYLF
jgi:hypothetical protein